MKWAMLVMLAAGCTPGGTRVRLDVKYDDSWQLDGVQVAPSPHPEVDAKMAHQLLLLVPDDSGAISIDLWGLHGSERRAWGHAEVTPIRGSEVRQDVALLELPCGAWCSPGASDCQGAATVVCIESADGCTNWSAPTACPSPSPFCSFGACGATCRDECAAGEERCDGTASVRVCAKGADNCLHWQEPLTCPTGQVCSNGACAATCSDECTAGATSCLSGGIITCGDSNHDGCLEWSPIVPCEAGASCSNGQCSTTCSDDCTANTCSGLTYRMCGQFSPDSCNHLSAGTSCVPSDPCQVGRCSDSGCQSAPKVCGAPPASECTDASTLRVYDTSGICAAGTCSYASHDVACANCPNCDPCAGVTCNTPPSSCFAAAGTCQNGSCSYPYADGVSCSTGDACMTGGSCASGVCVGTPMSCTTPPASTCTSPTSLRSYQSTGSCSSGACNYPFSDMTCSSCANGACCVPNCSGKSCGSADGCGGSCVKGCWSTVASLPTGRWGLAVATAIDGRIYAIGGADGSDDTPLNVVEEYTPGPPGTPGSWRTVAPMPTARYLSAATVGLDGRIHVSGGRTNSGRRAVVEVYTPGAPGDPGSWASEPSLVTARSGQASVTGSDGRIYIFGGYGGPSDSPDPLSSVEAYTPGSSAWVKVASLSTARGALCGAAGADGRIYAIGGDVSATTTTFEPVATVEAFTIGAKSWTSLAPLSSAVELQGCAASVTDGRIYMAGGFDGTNSLTTASAYAPGAGQWVTLPNMTALRDSLGIAAGIDGRIYAISGEDTDNMITNSVEVYTP